VPVVGLDSAQTVTQDLVDNRCDRVGAGAQPFLQLFRGICPEERRLVGVAVGAGQPEQAAVQRPLRLHSAAVGENGQVQKIRRHRLGILDDTADQPRRLVAKILVLRMRIHREEERLLHCQFADVPGQPRQILI
jgi:hypothetical protein